MIRTNREYEITQQRLEENRVAIDETRAYLQAEGFTSDEIETLLESLHAIGKQLLNEVEEYERVRAGQLQPCPFQALERLLIGGRIARDLTQDQFAALLGYSDSSTVSRDEGNDYRGAKRERIQRALDVLGIDVLMVPRLREGAAAQGTGWQEFIMSHMGLMMTQASPVTVANATKQVSATAADHEPSAYAYAYKDVARQSITEQNTSGEVTVRWAELSSAVGYDHGALIDAQTAPAKDSALVGASNAWAA